MAIELIPCGRQKRLAGIFLLVGCILAPTAYGIFFFFAQTEFTPTVQADGQSTSVRAVTPNVPAFNDFAVTTGFENATPEMKPTFAYLLFIPHIAEIDPEDVSIITVTIPVDLINIKITPQLADATYVMELWQCGSTWDESLTWNSQSANSPMTRMVGNQTFIPNTDMVITIDIDPAVYSALIGSQVDLVMKIRAFDLPSGVDPVKAKLILTVIKSDIDLQYHYVQYIGSTEIIMWVIIGIGCVIAGTSLLILIRASRKTVLCDLTQ